jgi:uncharacterized protein
LKLDAEIVPSAPVPPPRPSTLRRVFIGQDGIRAGWSLLIFIALFAAIAFCANRIGHKVHPAKPPKPGEELSPSFFYVGESVVLFITLVVTWIMSKIERRPNSVYGFAGERKLPNFLAGLAWGVTCLSLLVLALWKTGLLAIDGRLIFGLDMVRYGAIWLLGFFLVGLLEEYLTRGYLQYTLSRGLAGFYNWAFSARHSEAFGFWSAAIVLSFLFGLGHDQNPGESPIGLIAAGLVALIFCFSLWRTGSLWWAIGFHTAWDWSQSFLFGAADSGTMVQHHLLATHPVGKPILSGGATGPEGSIFVLAVLALATLIILVTLRPVPHRLRG